MQFDYKIIKEAREAKGLTLRGLSELTGIHINVINSWELGRTAPNMDSLGRICGPLGKSPDDFFVPDEA